MKKKISQWILRLFGWTSVFKGEDVPKSVICVAPHTSNTDFSLGKLYYNSIGKESSFLMKKEWFVFPFGCIFRRMGGVPIDRSKSVSITEQMAEEFNQRDSFHLAITPEGTRKKAEEWKKGFYYIALKANVPIQIAFIDYKKKVLGIMGTFYPTGDVEVDIPNIQAYYKGIQGLHKQNF